MCYLLLLLLKKMGSSYPVVLGSNKLLNIHEPTKVFDKERLVHHIKILVSTPNYTSWKMQYSVCQVGAHRAQGPRGRRSRKVSETQPGHRNMMIERAKQ